MISLFLLDVLINRLTIIPSFFFLIDFRERKYLEVLIGGMIMDIFLGSCYNFIVLNILYIINKKLFKKRMFFKRYYFNNLFNLLFYYSFGFGIFKKGFITYFKSLIGIIIIYSLGLVISYKFREDT